MENFETVEDVLAHYGVPGMKWGRRKSSSGPTEVVVTERSGKTLKTSGGKGQSASDEAKSAAATRQKAKSSSVDSLSNKELQAVVQRMNLERQYNTLKVDRASPASKFVRKLLIDTGKQQVTSLVGDQANRAASKAKK